MLIWFVVISLLGLRGILQAPRILGAISPHHAVTYLAHAGPGVGFAVLGAAFLAVTGGEAMYADMGHFGRLPIRLGWFAVSSPPWRSTILARARCSSSTLMQSRTRFTCSRQGGPIIPWWVCHPGDDHRFAGHHLRRLLADPANDPTRVSPRGVLHTASHEKGRSISRW